MAAKIAAAVARVWPSGFSGGASVGVVEAEPGGGSAADVLAAADREMYADKRARRIRRAS